jgi:glutaredoxin
MTSSVPPRRCERHDLAAAPDGQCVLCRREQSGGAREISAWSADSNRAFAWAAFALLVALGCGVWAMLGGRLPSPPSASATSQPAARVVRHETHSVELDAALAVQPEKTPEEQLEELQRAQAVRDRERASAAQVQKEQAELQRKLEEQARDRLRHETIMRELDSAALAGARRAVDVVMYSTTWCGFCAKARAYMHEKNIRFSDFDIEQDQDARARAQALNPRGSVPTISVDGAVLIGFSANALEQRIAAAATRRQAAK